MTKPHVAHTLTLAAVLLIMSGLIAHPNDTAQSARDALILCANVLIPSLFPFFALSSFVIESGLGEKLGRKCEKIMQPLFHVCGSGSSALILGLLGGYPVGASIASELYSRGECSKHDAERLLAFCNNCGPAFIFGAVGGGIFGSARLGAILYAVHLIAAVLVGMLFRFYHPGDITSSHTSHKNPQKSILSAFPTSVKNALSQTLNVCAFVVFFAVLVKILNLFGILPAICKIFGGTALSKAAISGALEMTTGLFTLSPNADTLRTSLIMASAILGFGGFSVHAQALSFIVQSKLSPRTYIGGKFLHAILSAALTALFTANTYTLAVNPTRFLPIFCALFIFLAVLIKKHWKKSRG